MEPKRITSVDDEDLSDVEEEAEEVEAAAVAEHVGGIGGSADERRRPRARIVSLRVLELQLLDEPPAEDWTQAERPKTRGECKDGLRPCPWVSCRHHLWMEDEGERGIKLNFPDLDFDEIPETCSLDVADRGPVTLDEVGVVLNLTRERARQIEDLASRRFRRAVILAREADEKIVAEPKPEVLIPLRVPKRHRSVQPQEPEYAPTDNYERVVECGSGTIAVARAYVSPDDEDDDIADAG